MPWNYLLADTTWSLGGLLIGYVVGRTERDVTWLRHHIESKERNRAE